jgi:hypothetical protein
MKQILLLTFCTILCHNMSTAQEKTSLFKDDKYEVIFDYYKDLSYYGLPFKNVIYIKSQNQNDTVGYSGSFPIGKAFFDGEYLVSSYGDTYGSLFSIKKKIDGEWLPIFWHQSNFPVVKREGLKYSLDAVDLTHIEETLTEPSGVVTKNLYEINMEKKEYTMYRIREDRSRTLLITAPFPDHYRYNKKK